MVPYNRLRKKGEVEQAQDTELSLLTEIRNLLKDGVSAETVTGPGTGPSPDTAKNTSADKIARTRTRKQPPAEAGGCSR